ncbi:MAG: hypothetical protein M0002_00385 [Rhodospirillales bacterium]|nr:hypothetical protein [Rhodospirillales bacterium]
MRGLLLVLLVALPAYAQGPGLGNDLANLLAALKAAPDRAAADRLERRIAAAWLGEASPAVRLLLESGARALGAHAPHEAERDFAAATVLQPTLAEAWSDRAVAHFRAGDTTAAIDDVAHALTLDPDHFTALETLSYVAEARGDWAGALAAWEKLLSIDPEVVGGAARLKELMQRALGQGA